MDRSNRTLLTFRSVNFDPTTIPYVKVTRPNTKDSDRFLDCFQVTRKGGDNGTTVCHDKAKLTRGTGQHLSAPPR